MNPTSAAVPVELVSVVIPTRDRLELMRRAIAAVIAQDHPGAIEVIAVFDHADIDHTLTQLSTGNRTVRCLGNDHAPGLAGARNSGVAAARGDVVAFCDDDDEWRRDKLTRQLEHLGPESPVVSCGVDIAYKDERFTRFPPTELTSHMDFLRHRVPSIHSSTLIARREFLAAMAGPLDEDIPGSYGEDWDFLLRATEAGPVYSVPAPLVTVHWHEKSYFIDNWTIAARGLDYLVTKHAGFSRDRRARGRITGQRAFYHAAAGRRGDGARMALAGLLAAPTGKHAWAALLVSAGLITPQRVLGAAHGLGKGV